VDRARNRIGRPARVRAHRHRAAGQRGYTWTRTLASESQFFVQGDMDELCPIRDMWTFYAQLKEPKELVVIQGASHLFDGHTQDVGEALEDLLGDYE
jgi:alpha/beta superfamily hydrolase